MKRFLSLEQRAMLQAWERGEGATPDVASLGETEVEEVVRTAMAEGDPQTLHDAILLLRLSPHVHLDLRNHLLGMPGHRFHQAIARDLQGIADPQTVPFVAEVLAKGYDFLSYTASDDAVITKWFSWLLADIGTPEALALIEAHANSANPEVAFEMRYRLTRIRPPKR